MADTCEIDNETCLNHSRKNRVIYDKTSNAFKVSIKEKKCLVRGKLLHWNGSRLGTVEI